MTLNQFNLINMNRTTRSKQTFAKLRIHLYIMAIFLTIIFISCNSGADKTQTQSSQVNIESIPSVVAQNDSLDAVVKSIIEISANDFFKNQQPLPISFRNVQVKYSIKPNKELLYILCGEFATEDKQNNDEWTHFTTIKNSDYEQWIGPNGLTYCENSKEIPYTKTDLSIELKNKLNSIQKIEK
jgi:hypothetical protein